MGLNFKVLFSTAILGVGSANAYLDSDYLTIKKVKVQEISKDVLNQETLELLHEKDIEPLELPEKGAVTRIQNVGEIIAIGNELVALGERIYNLVNKGRPNVQTSYAPISVLPKENWGAVDIMDTEGWKVPVKRSYLITYENLYGMDVVVFKYSVIFAYGGSYKGKGAYLAAAQIVPENVSVSWGFDFKANMKLNGLQNHGTKSGPIAGAILQIDYTVSNILKSESNIESYHVMGNGGFRKL